VTLNLIKLAVGAESVGDIRRFQIKRKKELGRIVHWTTMFPKRVDEIVKGKGSLYWVIGGLILVRQRIKAIERTKSDKKPVAIVLDAKLVRVEPRGCRPFQGWRYFDSAKAPKDIDAKRGEAIAKAPPAMLRKLRDMGLL